MYTRRLKLETLFNCRDLGGYAVPGGRTKFGVFLRSEMPFGICENDAAALREYGVTDSMDFRSTPESQTRPSDFVSAEWVEYHHMPTYPEYIVGDAEVRFDHVNVYEPGFTWGGSYIKMVTNGKEWVKKCMLLAAECEGVLHFHCFTGKDRTGVFAALLLGVAGVDKTDIVADYCVSECLLDPFYIKNLRNFDPVNRQNNLDNPFVYTAPSNMFMLLSHLESEYGGVTEFVKHCGVSDGTIEKIREKFIEK